ncbi:MAG TPA: hypothetical protein VEX88_04960 [Glaciibacter sp.]|nr:hypothetical protein [Glaciibacter sp.]
MSEKVRDFVDQGHFGISLTFNAEAGMRRVIEVLENHHAPRGSWAQLDGGPRVEFGRYEGLALILAGPLPAEFLNDFVPTNAAVEDMLPRLARRLGPYESIQSWFHDRDEVRITCYGPSADDLRASIVAAVADETIAQGCRLEALT